MSDGGLTVVDGTHLKAVDLSLPVFDDTVTLAKVLELAESKASSALFGLSLPVNIKSSALKRLGIDFISFRRTELDSDQASSKLKDYVTAITDELNDEPLVVAILDGKTLRLFMEDEDDFAMLAENLFTDLDIEDKGKISKHEIRNALVNMGVEMGIPPFSEFPLLNEILKRHVAEGEEKLGQAQFAQLLQPVLQELVDALAEKHVVVIQNIKVINGSKLRKIIGEEAYAAVLDIIWTNLLASENQLNDVIEKILQEKHNERDGEKSTEIIRCYLEKNGRELGLPPSEADESVVHLYNTVFADVENGKSAIGLENDEVRVCVKEIIEKFAEQLEVNPVFHDLGN